jgi:hypothetical protein
VFYFVLSRIWVTCQNLIQKKVFIFISLVVSEAFVQTLTIRTDLFGECINGGYKEERWNSNLSWLPAVRLNTKKSVTKLFAL